MLLRLELIFNWLCVILVLPVCIIWTYEWWHGEPIGFGLYMMALLGAWHFTEITLRDLRMCRARIQIERAFRTERG